MEEMEEWLIMQLLEAPTMMFKEKKCKDHSLMYHLMKVLEDMNRTETKKKKKAQEELLKRYYDGYVYKVLPYPPHIKSRDDAVCK